MSLRTPEKVEKLQAALHAKAKGAPSFRFYALYDKVYREDVLAFAYRLCRHNRGVAGVDGERFEDIDASGVDRWLGALTQELRSKNYRPKAVRINRLLWGWSSDFCVGPVSPAYRSVDRHASSRLRLWLCRKHKVSGRGNARFPHAYLHQELGLIWLEERTRSFPWANA